MRKVRLFIILHGGNGQVMRVHSPFWHYGQAAGAAAHGWPFCSTRASIDETLEQVAIWRLLLTHHYALGGRAAEKVGASRAELLNERTAAAATRVKTFLSDSSAVGADNLHKEVRV
jgi:hypothetical protein